jgi:hypothetical protein
MTQRGGTRRVTDRQFDEAIELLRAGVHPKEVARTLGIGLSALYWRLRKRRLTAEGKPGRAHLNRRKPVVERPQPDPTDVVLALREQGLTFEAIGARLGVTRQRAHQIYHASHAATSQAVE